MGSVLNPSLRPRTISTRNKLHTLTVPSSPPRRAMTDAVQLSAMPAPTLAPAPAVGTPHSRAKAKGWADDALPWEFVKPARTDSAQGEWMIEGGKKVWRRSKGEVESAYPVGYERDVLDLEARLHMTLYDLAGGSHTFATFSGIRQPPPPKRVLDLGTGLGLWPVAQAAIWPEASFIGLDLVPCQVDLDVLASAEEVIAPSVQPKLGGWRDARQRITWENRDILAPLPYDSGSFDMVHIRFVGLGIPETKWGDLLEEAVRVLKRGGILEVVETSYQLPASSPPSLVHSFSSLLLSQFIHPIPTLPLSFTLSFTTGLVASTISKPVFSKTYNAEDAPSALRGATLAWVRSALGGRGTALVRSRSKERSKGERDVAQRMGRELRKWGGIERWGGQFAHGNGLTSSEEDPERELPVADQPKEGQVIVSAWVGRKE